MTLAIVCARGHRGGVREDPYQDRHGMGDLRTIGRAYGHDECEACIEDAHSNVLRWMRGRRVQILIGTPKDVDRFVAVCLLGGSPTPSDFRLGKLGGR